MPRRISDSTIHTLQSTREASEVDNTLTLRALLAAALASIVLSDGAAARQATEKVLYSFDGGTDGADPVAPLTKVGNKFYGTTVSGGSGGFGTVFSVTSEGIETALHSFAAGDDGGYPRSALLGLGGTLFGTTSRYGLDNCDYCGTIFSITKKGAENVVYRFKSGGDGAQSQSGVINVDGTFYGTTGSGGANGYGAIFSVTPSGVETVLHSFGANGDGIEPVGTLVRVGSKLYGTTFRGGTANNGTVFSITKAGVEKVIYSFHGGDDAALPEAGLIEVAGILYGTTAFGGGTGCPDLGNSCGTIFSVTTNGVEAVLHRFGHKNDGAQPIASLISVGSKLYGTTFYGGAMGSGVVFSMTTVGAEKVIYSFGEGTDGGDPAAALLSVGAALYGTTPYGGTHGFGTVFTLTP
jgi:uncharacterized repeat protein (TIGR03803 family)